MIQIKVDDRETNKALIESLMTNVGVSTNVCRLSIGDYQVNDALLVERKTIKDFCISIKDGRLFRQAAKLSIAPIQGIVILEGNSSDFEASGFSREAVQGALITLSLLYRIPLLRSKMPEETARLILYAFRQVRDKGNQQFAPRPFPYNRRLKNKYKRQAHVLQGLPGIGPKRAKLLIDHFGSLKAIFNALPHELEKTIGIGKDTIKKIEYIIE
ncbi:MAG: ERCC4 domain-containing protein [Fulvivirga sp.]